MVCKDLKSVLHKIQIAQLIHIRYGYFEFCNNRKRDRDKSAI